MNPDGTIPTNNQQGTGPAELLKQANAPYVPSSPTISPSLTYTKQPAPPSTYMTVAQNPPTPVAPSSAKQSPIIRTFESDVADVVNRKKASTLTIALAESRRTADTASISSNEPPTQYGKSILKILTSLTLFLAGAVGLYFLYLYSPLAPARPVPVTINTIPSIITPDHQTLIPIDTSTGKEIFRAIDAAETKIVLQGGGMEEIIFTKKDGENTYRAEPSDVIPKLDIPMPDLILRSLEKEWMFGFIVTDKPTPFILITNNFFQNAFAGMLKWESEIVDDMAKIFKIEPKAAPKTVINTGVATSTATSTATTTTVVDIDPPLSFFSIRGKFEDATIKNKDVRRFKDASGNVLFLYSFIDKDTIIMTTNEAAFVSIIDRIEKQTHIR
jgi:hypothetical protein